MMVSDRVWHGSIHLLSVCAVIRCASLPTDHGEGKNPFQTHVQDEREAHVFPHSQPQAGRGDKSRSNSSTAPPMSVYDFQTGKLSFHNGDLNDSGANAVPVRVSPAGPANPTNRSTKFSSRYSKGWRDPRRGSVRFGAKTNGDPAKDSLQNEGNERVEIYKDPKSDEVAQRTADSAPAESEHKSKGDKKHSEGEGEEHHEDHHDKHGAKGEKGYKGEHHYHKGEKGHHDKEQHKGQYSDKKGTKKSHKEGGGHFEAGLHGEKGHKDTKHSDKEEYKKGHSTRGGHVVHKKDEYEKKHEFYDEHHEGGEGEKHGEYFQEHKAHHGGHKKKAHKHGNASGHHKGKKGHFEKGKKYHEHKGHKKDSGHDKKHEHDEKYGKKEGESHWKTVKYGNGKDKGKADSGGGHSQVHEVRRPLPHKPPKKSDIKSMKNHQKFADGETRQIHRLQAEAAATALVVAEPPQPANKHGPGKPKITISRFRFPPVKIR